jgi:hypothetical protein
MKKIFVCSPFKGNIFNNIRNAIRCCKFVSNLGYIPFAPHLHYPRFLNDHNEKQREIGIQSGLAFLKHCDELWYFGEYVSEGMLKEIHFAKTNNIPVVQQKMPEK